MGTPNSSEALGTPSSSSALPETDHEPAILQEWLDTNSRESDLKKQIKAAGYSQADTHRIKQQVEDALDVREIVRKASGETLDLKPFEADMRHLIDTYIESAAMSKEDFAAKLVATMSWWEVLTVVMLELKTAKVLDIQSHPYGNHLSRMSHLHPYVSLGPVAIASSSTRQNTRIHNDHGRFSDE